MFKSIKIKLLVLISVLTLVPLLITNSYLIFSYSGILQNEMQTHLKDTARTEADYIDTWLEGKISRLEQFVKTHKNYNFKNKDYILEELDDLKLVDIDVESFAFGSADGRIETMAGKTENIRNTEYFKKARDTKRTSISDVLTVKFNNKGKEKKVIEICVPIYENNRFKGVICNSINADKILKSIKKIKIGDTGYGYVLNRATTVFVIHPEKKNVGKKYEYVNPDNENLFNMTVFRKHSGIVSYTAFDKTARIAYYHLVKSADWQMVVTAKKSEIFKEMNNKSFMTLIIIIISGIITALIGIFVGASLVKPIKKVTELLIKTEKLDLVLDNDFLELYKRNDETGVMAKALGNTRKSIRELVGKLQNTSLMMENNAKVLSKTLGETKSTINGIAKAVDDLAYGSTDLAKNTETGADQLNILSNKIEEISKISSEVQGFIEYGDKAKGNGMQAVNNLQEAIKNNEAVSAKVGSSVLLLDGKSKEVTVITETIKDITTKVNLLSLNAAIEAAKAGEAGKGFAVVANEIKKLAADTAKSTVKIENIINEFRKIIEDVKKEMLTAGEVIKNTSVMSNSTGDAFTEIDVSMTNIIKRIIDLSNQIKEINKNKVVVVGAIHDISAVSQESAASTEEMSAAIDAQSSNMEQISVSADELYNISIEIKAMVSGFKIE